MDRKIKNGPYYDRNLDMIAYPLGGLGAGMICLEGTGAFSHFSIMHNPDIFNEPQIYAAICIKNPTGNKTRVLEGQVPDWKFFRVPNGGNGASAIDGSTPTRNYGLPRFKECSFESRFPFAKVLLQDETMPISAEITGWSPFIPGDEDRSGMPIAGIEYKVFNHSDHAIEAVFSFNCPSFLGPQTGKGIRRVSAAESGFIMEYQPPEETGWEHAWFAVSSDHPAAVPNCRWLRSGWFDPAMVLWQDISMAKCEIALPYEDEEKWHTPGASIVAPVKLEPGCSDTIRIMLSWYVPSSNLRIGKDEEQKDGCSCSFKSEKRVQTYAPWYASFFKNINEVMSYWADRYTILKEDTTRFTDCIYATTLPNEIVDAVTANLSILKSPTILRQQDGRIWAWEGCCDRGGCCFGTCTHVWNYAQALPHLFPSLERSLRQTEFNENQNEEGHQNFRAFLPIRPTDHSFYAAADGQLGGVIKVFRDWRITGDTDWLRKMWPKITASINYCIKTWDPHQKGILEKPHHNTYDIEFWSPDSLSCSIYLGALRAASLMATALSEDSSTYEIIYCKGKEYLENRLFNGEYFSQEIYEQSHHMDSANSEMPYELVSIISQQGPKYQIGNGCLTDGVLGEWMAQVCGVGTVINTEKVRSHLESVYRYNFKRDLMEHANAQRSGFAAGKEGGVLICTWPHGGRPTIHLIYSDEVWTGIEYQSAAHMALMGMVEECCEIVRTVRDRYNGIRRNPFNEYECGHWYARALSSYSLLQALSGARYDAVEKKMYIAPKVKGDFKCFISTVSGYGLVGVEEGKPFLDVYHGVIEVEDIVYSPAKD